MITQKKSLGNFFLEDFCNRKKKFKNKGEWTKNSFVPSLWCVLF